MKIQKKHIIFIILMLIFIISLRTKVFADTLTVAITSDKENYKIAETINITIDWKEKMQAASFKFEYDSNKLEFLSASINENFYNSKNAGEISVNWVSMQGEDLTQIKFQFKALKEGNANLSIKETPAFADGNLVSPTSYDISSVGTKSIVIEAEQKATEQIDTENKENKNDEIKKEKSNEDASLATNVLPKTGSESTIFIIIIAIGILSVFFFIKNRKYSDF